MKYSVSYSDGALKDLKKIDHYQATLIISWIEKHLVDCENPRVHGKSLKYDRKNEWRYRIGAYRILAEIEDEVVTIAIINVGHRKDIYN